MSDGIMKVLIVEDNKIKSELILKTIMDNDKNIIVEVSNNTINAKEKLKVNSYDLLILDLNLPDFEGEECKDELGMQLFKEISRSDKLYNKPAEIIIMTAYDNLKDKYEEEIQKGLFNIIKYDSSEESWKEKLVNKLNYIKGYKKSIGLEGFEQKKLLFISHSSQDIDYVKEFVELMEYIGFNSRELLFCSSLVGYDIPSGENIYDYLKKKFDNSIYVICLLSENYYSSPACMNEMGATWIKAEKYKAILLPGFEYSQLKGAIDASKLWLQLSDRIRINELKEELLNEFGLESIESGKWIDRLDKYINNINELKKKNKKIESKNIIFEEIIDEGNENSIKVILRFINKSSQTRKCKKLDIILEDKLHNSITISLNFKILNQFIFYKNENRRESIIIEKSNINGIEKFDINNWSVKHIEESWTSNF